MARSFSPAPFGRLLVGLGIVCLGWYSVWIARVAAFQHEQRAVLERAIEAVETGATADAAVHHTGLVGQLEIPRLGVSTIVMEGDAGGVLELAAGHLPETPLPWQNGNSVIAGHRDSFFRPLKDIRLGDEITLTSLRGIFRYRVRGTRITLPEDLSVLAPTSTPGLTLVTCYPFSFVGSAPQRFIVWAEREDR